MANSESQPVVQHAPYERTISGADGVVCLIQANTYPELLERIREFHEHDRDYR